MRSDIGADLAEDVSDVRQMLSSPLFQRLYQMQLSSTVVSVSAPTTTASASGSISPSSSSASYSSASSSQPKGSKKATSEKESEFLKAIRTVQLKRASHELNYGFTIILVNHSGLNQTFVFVQDVEPASIARYLSISLFFY